MPSAVAEAELPLVVAAKPSLDALDRMNQRLVRAGFVVFTVALITGALVASRVWKTWPSRVSAATRFHR